jgi:hypothetical protein
LLARGAKPLEKSFLKFLQNYFLPCIPSILPTISLRRISLSFLFVQFSAPNHRCLSCGVAGEKGTGGRSLKKTRKRKMTKLITRNEIVRLNDNELQGLYRAIFNELVQSDPDTAQRRNSLASLENLQREINQRHSNHCKPGAGL